MQVTIMRREHTKSQSEQKEPNNRSIQRQLFTQGSLFVTSVVAVAFLAVLNDNLNGVHSNVLKPSIYAYATELEREDSENIFHQDLHDVPLVANGESITTKNNIYQIAGTVPKVQWYPTHPFIDEVVQRGYPVVLKNTVVTTWDAMKWTPDVIAELVKEFTGVYKHTNYIFGPYWDPQRPMTTLPDIKRRNTHQHVNMTSQDFLDHMKHPEKDEFYYYYASNFAQVPQLAEALNTWEYIDLAPASETQNINFWIGQKGTTAETHYDAYENINVQVYGRKRWLLFPPDAPLYLYPFLHPSHAQSQVEIDTGLSLDVDKFPRVKDAVGLEVIMEPGDILYLPPLWFHHVEALDDSISLNCWSYSEQSQLMQNSVDLAYDLIHSTERKPWTTSQAQIVAQMLITLTVESVRGEETANSFVEKLLEQRYQDLFRSHQLPTSQEVPREFCKENPFARKEYKALKKEVQVVASGISRELLKTPENTQDVWLGNLVEFIAALGSQNVEYAGAFLQGCFQANQSSKDEL